MIIITTIIIIPNIGDNIRKTATTIKKRFLFKHSTRSQKTLTKKNKKFYRDNKV